MVRKRVLTGGPCSGKTSLIVEFEKLGYKIIHEVAREVIGERINNKVTSQEIRERQREMLRRQIILEDLTDLEEEIVFLDRGIIDGFAYSKYFLGNLPYDISNLKISGRYEKVFSLNSLPFIHDGLRIEKDDDEARKIHSYILREYKSQGYEVTEVPSMSLHERVKLILQRIGE